MIPGKPFETYKWRWLSVAPTESLLDAPVFLGVLRVLAQHENQPPSGPSLVAELQRVKRETRTPVGLARTGERNLIRNSGQYWKGTGLLRPDRGQIHLTPLGRRVATGQITQGEFAALMVQQTVLPNPWTYAQAEIAKWKAAELEIRPLNLILTVIEKLGQSTEGITSAYLTNNELIKVVIPLSGAKATTAVIARDVRLFRRGQLDIRGWPDCAPDSNDPRLAHEFLLFLANFGLLRLDRTGMRDNHRFYLDELFDIDAVAAHSEESIFGSAESSERALEEIRHSPFPSIIERQRILTAVLERKGQALFRARIMAAYTGRCFLTGEQIPEVLEAAHIVPVNHHGSDEENNGICLRVDIHRLFDSGNLRFRPSGDIILSAASAASHNYAALPKNIEYPRFVNPANIEWRDRYL